MKTFNFWILYFKTISLIFIAIGVYWSVSGSFDPLGIWDSQLAKYFYQTDVLSLEVESAKSFILAPFGATSAAYFILQYFLITHGVSKKEYWAWKAIVCAFSFWFILDSIMTIYHGAFFNLLLANLPCLLAMSPIFFLKKQFFHTNN